QPLKLRNSRVWKTPDPELLLALACHKVGQRDAALRWLREAQVWLDEGQLPVRAASLAGAGFSGPMAMFPLLNGEVGDPRRSQIRWLDWIDFQLLRREVEAQIQPQRVAYASPDRSPDRKAAEWGLWIGAKIRVNGEETAVPYAEELPQV